MKYYCNNVSVGPRRHGRVAARVRYSIIQYSTRHACLLRVLLYFLSPIGLALGLYAGVLMAEGPTGGQVTHGQGAITYPNAENGQTTVIDQYSPRLALEWESFNIPRGSRVQFIQQLPTDIALNRITDQNPSQILGSLIARGMIILTNPAGIYFGRDAVIDVGGLLAAGLDIDSNEFMQGRYVFSAVADTVGRVVNRGTIKAATGGVSLLGRSVENSGYIAAHASQVTLAAGDKITVDFEGDGLLRFSIDEAVLGEARKLDDHILGEDTPLEEGDPEDAIVNTETGEIVADGGTVLLTGRAAADVFTNVINNQGTIQARSIEDQDGEIRLIADGGEDNNIQISGRLDVSSEEGGGSIQVHASDTLLTTGSAEILATSSNGKGGKIWLTGDKVGLLDQTLVDASGETGGGEILVGGDYQGLNPAVMNASHTYVDRGVELRADAWGAGDGGKIVVWADGSTRFFGHASAKGGAEQGDGGLVEVSGRSYLDFSGTVDTRAPNGERGTLLLDPRTLTINNSAPSLYTGTNSNCVGNCPPMFDAPFEDYTIEYGEGPAEMTMFVDDITRALANSDVILQATEWIAVDTNIMSTEGGSLTLQAYNNIYLNSAQISLSGSGLANVARSLTLEAPTVNVGSDSDPNNAVKEVTLNADTVTINGQIIDNINNGAAILNIRGGINSHAQQITINGAIGKSTDPNSSLAQLKLYGDTTTLHDSVLVDGGILFDGDVEIAGTGSITIAAIDASSGAIKVGGDITGTNASSVSLRGANKVDIDGSITVGGDIALTSSEGAVDIAHITDPDTGVITALPGVTLEAGGDVSISGKNKVDINASIEARNITLGSAGDPADSDTGIVTVEGQLIAKAVDNGAGVMEGGVVDIDGTNKVDINESIKADGNITLTSSQGVVEVAQGTLITDPDTGVSTQGLTAGGDVSVSGKNKVDIDGSITAHNITLGSATDSSGNDIVADNVMVDGQLIAKAVDNAGVMEGGDVSVSGTSKVDINESIKADGNIMLTSSGGDVEVAQGTAITDPGTGVSTQGLDAGGLVNIDGKTGVTTNALIKATTGDIKLTSSQGTALVQGELRADEGDVSVSGTNEVDIDRSITARNITLDSSLGAVRIDGALTATAVDNGAGVMEGGLVDVDGNIVEVFAPITAHDIDLNSGAGDLTIGDLVTAGNAITLSAGNTVTIHDKYTEGGVEKDVKVEAGDRLTVNAPTLRLYYGDNTRSHLVSSGGNIHLNLSRGLEFYQAAGTGSNTTDLPQIQAAAGNIKFTIDAATIGIGDESGVSSGNGNFFVGDAVLNSLEVGEGHTVEFTDTMTAAVTAGTSTAGTTAATVKLDMGVDSAYTGYTGGADNSIFKIAVGGDIQDNNNDVAFVGGEGLTLDLKSGGNIGSQSDRLGLDVTGLNAEAVDGHIYIENHGRDMAGTDTEYTAYKLNAQAVYLRQVEGSIMLDQLTASTGKVEIMALSAAADNGNIGSSDNGISITGTETATFRASGDIDLSGEFGAPLVLEDAEYIKQEKNTFTVTDTDSSTPLNIVGAHSITLDSMGAEQESALDADLVLKATGGDISLGAGGNRLSLDGQVRLVEANNANLYIAETIRLGETQVAEGLTVYAGSVSVEGKVSAQALTMRLSDSTGTIEDTDQGYINAGATHFSFFGVGDAANQQKVILDHEDNDLGTVSFENRARSIELVDDSLSLSTNPAMKLLAIEDVTLTIDSGNDDAVTLKLDQIETSIGTIEITGQGDNDILVGRSVDNTWELEEDRGEVDGVKFSQIGILQGNDAGTDTLSLQWDGEAVLNGQSDTGFSGDINDARDDINDARDDINDASSDTRRYAFTNMNAVAGTTQQLIVDIAMAGTYTLGASNGGQYTYNGVDFGIDNSIDRIRAGAGNDTFNIVGEEYTGNLYGHEGDDTFNIAGRYTGNLYGHEGDDTFRVDRRVDGISPGSGWNTVTTANYVPTSPGEAAIDTYEVAGTDRLAYSAGSRLADTLTGDDTGSSLTIPDPAQGMDIVIGGTDLLLPTSMTGFAGHLIIGGRLLKGSQLTGASPFYLGDNVDEIQIDTESIVVQADIETGGAVTLLADDQLTLEAYIDTGGQLGLVAGGSINGPDTGTVTLSSPMVSNRPSAVLIGVDGINNSENIVLDFGGGEVDVLVGNAGAGDTVQFNALSNQSDQTDDADLLRAYQLGGLISNLFPTVTLGSARAFSLNPVEALQLLQQFAFVDSALFEEDLELYGRVGEGVALSLSQCEEQEACAPSVTEEELNNLITGLERRILVLSERMAGERDRALQASREEQVKQVRVFRAYRNELADYLAGIQQTDQSSREELQTLAAALERVHHRTVWLEILREPPQAAQRAALGKKMGIELTTDYLDRLIRSADRQAQSIQQRIDSLAGSKVEPVFTAGHSRFEPQYIQQDLM